MQLPVAIVQLQLKGPDSQKRFVTQLVPNVDYCLFSDMIVKLNVVDRNKLCLSKDALQDICSLASTEKDRKLIKFVACQASGFSNKRTGQQYGVYNFSSIRNEVRNALQDEIREAVLKLASVQERARLESF